MAYSKSREERLLEQLLAKNTEIDLNTDGLELSIGGKYDSSGNRGGGLSNGDIVPVSINASGETIVALSATDNEVLDAMVIDLAAMEILLNQKRLLLITIDADTNAIKTATEAIQTDAAAIEV